MTHDRTLFDEYISGSMVVFALGYARQASTLYHPNSLNQATEELLRADGYTEFPTGFGWSNPKGALVPKEEHMPRLLVFIQAGGLTEYPPILALLARLSL